MAGRGGGGAAGSGAAGAGAAATVGGVTGAGGAPRVSAPTRNTARQTEHRARTPPAGTLAGSTRKTVEQLGQVTFIVASSTLVPSLAGGG